MITNRSDHNSCIFSNDVYAGSQIGFGLQFGTLETCPEFKEYWGRISDRPAYGSAADKSIARLLKRRRGTRPSHMPRLSCK
jgi:hypothetical protein